MAKGEGGVRGAGKQVAGGYQFNRVTTAGVRNGVASMWDATLNETTAGNPMSARVKAVQAYKATFTTSFNTLERRMRVAVAPDSLYGDAVNFARSLELSQGQLRNISNNMSVGATGVWNAGTRREAGKIADRMNGFLGRYRDVLDAMYGG